MAKNLIVILSDEHQASALSTLDHPFVKTPHLDKLAARGTIFTNAYTPSPICVPARAAFATGRYAHQTAHWDNATPYIGTPTGWGHQLQDAGIAVDSIGKLHYRDSTDPVGFDNIHIPMMVKDGVGMVWASLRHEEERLYGQVRMLGDEIGPGESSYTRYDRAVTDRTIKWLADNKGREDGFCLYVGLVAPHFPLIAPDEFYDLYRNVDFPDAKLHPKDGHKRHPWIEKQNAMMSSEDKFQDEDERRRAFIAYYGLVSWLDHNVGQIIKAIDDNGFGNDTTIIYSSDHGDNVGARGLWGKSNCYEESAKIPMIMAGPDIPQGKCETAVSLLDVSATIPSFFGITPDSAMVGTSLPDLLASDQNQNRVIFSEYHAVGAVNGAFMIRYGDYKLIHYEGFEPELFNLSHDPEELVNLAFHEDYKDVLADLYDKLAAICDTAAVNQQAHDDQRALVDSFGGLAATRELGAKGATPPPDLESA